MSESLAVIGSTLPATTPAALDKVRVAEERVMQLEQAPIQTEHILHGGMYSRTVRLIPGTVIVGALLKVPTVLIVNGSTKVMAGEKWYDLEGYNIMPASRGRKQIFVTTGPTEITMIFATKAKTVEEAEAEFSDECDKLLSRRQGDDDLVTITGE